MKIAMILDSPFPPDVRVEKEALSLIGEGHQVHLFCLDYKKSQPREDYKGIHLHRYRSNTLEYKLSALAHTIPLYRWAMQQKIRDFIATVNPDVVHVHDMVIAEAAIVEASSRHIQVVLDLHENRPEIMKEYRHLQRFPGRYLISLNTWKRKQRELIDASDKVIVVTDRAREVVVSESNHGVESVFVVPNTPSSSFAQHPLDQVILDRMAGTFNILYVGDTSERRGTMDLVLLAERMRNEIPQLRIWIIGTSSFDGELRDRVRKLHLKDFVIFEGWQQESLFPSYIAGAQICVSPLKRNLHHDTTFANKIFQYMSLGKPSIVSDCVAQAELVIYEKCGEVYPAGDIEQLADRLRSLYAHPETRERYGANAKMAVADRWNWENTSLELIRLYNDMKLSKS